MPEPVDISCDESGNTGENLTGSQDVVFSEGSHDLSLEESTELLDWVRRESGTRAPEIKWKHIRDDEELVDELFSDRLAGRARFYLTEKSYFVVGKVIDLLLEEHAHNQGRDMYANGEARKQAFVLYRNGRRALGESGWAALLGSFNSLMRRDTATQRLNGVPKTTVDEFFTQVDDARSNSKRRNVTDILNRLHATKDIADEFVSDLDPARYPIPSLDPLVPSLAQTVRHWYQASGRREVNVLHDEGPIPSSTAMDAMRDVLRAEGAFKGMAPPVKIGTISTGQSSSDVRLQLADFVAGFGAQSGRRALDGHLTQSEAATVRGTIFPTSLWGDDASADVLGLSV